MNGGGVVLPKVLRVACDGNTVGSGVDPVSGIPVGHWKMVGVMLADINRYFQSDMVIQFGARAKSSWDLCWDGSV